MHIVYILHTAEFDRYYIGETIDLVERLKEHNSGRYINSSTKYADDWTIRLSFKVKDRMEARKLEKYIKSMKSKKFIKKLIDDTDFQESFKQKVFDKYQIEIL